MPQEKGVNENHAEGTLGCHMLFFNNGFVTGGWAVQIAQLVPRFGVSDKAIGYLILNCGFGALTMIPISGILMESRGPKTLTCLAPAGKVQLAGTNKQM